MSDAVFERCAELDALGVEHGLGLRGSDDVFMRDLVTARQVHGTRLARVPSDESPLEADAVYTTEPGLAVAVRTADCVPILLVDAQLRGVAAVHAGWRGSAEHFAEQAVSQLVTALAIEPADLWAVVGPHIGPCCYEVDQPVHEAVGDNDAFGIASRVGHYMLDLYLLNLQQLLAAGVAQERVLRVGACTACHRERYPSHRRDGTGGRILHYVRMPHA